MVVNDFPIKSVNILEGTQPNCPIDNIFEMKFKGVSVQIDNRITLVVRRVALRKKDFTNTVAAL